MIGLIRGELIELSGGIALVEAGGVGYEIRIPESMLMQLPPPGAEVALRIRQVFREDGVSLYGFLDRKQRDLFDHLMEVKGCGPRIGLSLLSDLGEQTVVGAILQGDARTLAKASGVGTRLAERLILELKEKISQFSLNQKFEAVIDASAGNRTSSDDVVEALVSLGYRRPDAERAAGEAAGTTTEERIRTALRSLGR